MILSLFFFQKNKLKSLPTELGNLSCLEVLSFNENLIDDIPNELYLLEQLRLFGMDDNPLAEIPSYITEGGSQEVFNYLGERLSKQQQGFELLFHFLILRRLSFCLMTQKRNVYL